MSDLSFNFDASASNLQRDINAQRHCIEALITQINE